MDYPVYKHLLLPRTGAFSRCVKTIKEAGGTKLVDVTLGYPEDSPWKDDPYNLIDLTQYHVNPLKIHCHVIEYDLSEVDETSEESMRDFLFKMYNKKGMYLWCVCIVIIFVICMYVCMYVCIIGIELSPAK